MTDADPSSCGKRCYPSVRRARECNSRNHHRLRVYLCLECRAYHVTKRDNGYDGIMRRDRGDRERWAAGAGGAD